MEVVLASGARCDCVTDSHAIEFDFSDKWAEAIGQALHYSAQTGKRAGIVLIVETPEKDSRQIDMLRSTIEDNGLPIDVWIIP